MRKTAVPAQVPRMHHYEIPHCSSSFPRGHYSSGTAVFEAFAITSVVTVAVVVAAAAAAVVVALQAPVCHPCANSQTLVRPAREVGCSTQFYCMYSTSGGTRCRLVCIDFTPLRSGARTNLGLRKPPDRVAQLGCFLH